jgi:hypothetical protein
MGREPTLLCVNREARQHGSKYFETAQISVGNTTLSTSHLPDNRTLHLNTGPAAMPDLTGDRRSSCPCIARNSYNSQCGCSRLSVGADACLCPHAPKESNQRHFLFMISLLRTTFIETIVLHMTDYDFAREVLEMMWTLDTKGAVSQRQQTGPDTG